MKGTVTQKCMVVYECAGAAKQEETLQLEKETESWNWLVKHGFKRSGGKKSGQCVVMSGIIVDKVL